MIDHDAVPDELQDRDQWLLWDSSSDTPRRPHWKGDFHISWSDPDQWHSYAEAVEASRTTESWGIGYVTAAENPDYARGIYGVVDIDGAAGPDDHPKDWVPSLQPFSTTTPTSSGRRRTTNRATRGSISPSSGWIVPTGGTTVN